MSEPWKPGDIAIVVKFGHLADGRLVKLRERFPGILIGEPYWSFDTSPAVPPGFDSVLERHLHRPEPIREPVPLERKAEHPPTLRTVAHAVADWHDAHRDTVHVHVLFKPTLVSVVLCPIGRDAARTIRFLGPLMAGAVAAWLDKRLAEGEPVVMNLPDTMHFTEK